MKQTFDWQDPLAVIMAGLVTWGWLQLSRPYALPAWVVAAAGVLSAVLLLVWHFRTSRREGPGGAVESGAFPLPGKREAWVVAGLVGVALLLRLYTLLDRPAWDDEMWTLRNMYTSSWTELFRVAFDDYWPPLHYVILNAVARVADTGLLWLRLPSVVFGVATVAVIYPVGKRMLGDRFSALVATALLAGSTSHVLYSQEARVYALQVFLAVLSAHTFFTSYWERRISPAFVVSTTLLTYSHSFASWYFVACQPVYVLASWIIWRDREAFVKGVLSQVIVLLLWMPLAGAFAYSRMAREILVPTYWASAPEDSIGLVQLVEQYQGLAVRSWAGAAFMAVLMGVAVLRAISSGGDEAGGEGVGTGEGSTIRYRRASLFLLCWITVPVLVSMGMTAATSLDTFIEIRYHLAVLPGLCLAAAAGLGALRSRATATAVLLMVVLVPAADLPRYYRDFNRPAVDEAARIVHRDGRPGELVYVGGEYRAFAYYYRGFFPRIGSAQWDSLAASNLDLGDEHTLESVKWGDTYAFEKLPREVRHFTYYNPPPASLYETFITAELERGGFRGSFWLVLHEPPQPILDMLPEAGVVCDDARTYSLREVRLIYCNPPGGP